MTIYLVLDRAIESLQLLQELNVLKHPRIHIVPVELSQYQIDLGQEFDPGLRQADMDCMRRNMESRFTIIYDNVHHRDKWVLKLKLN